MYHPCRIVSHTFSNSYTECVQIDKVALCTNSKINSLQNVMLTASKEELQHITNRHDTERTKDGRKLSKANITIDGVSK